MIDYIQNSLNVITITVLVIFTVPGVVLFGIRLMEGKEE